MTPKQHKDVVDYVYELKRKDSGVEISNVGGWQSKSTAQTDLPNVLIPMFEHMRQLTTEVMHDLNFLQEKYVPVVDNYWFNVNGKRDFNMGHNHAGSALSGVVYLKVPKNSGGIRFEREDAQTWAFPATVTGNIKERNDSMIIAPGELDFILFPASLRHNVEPNQSDEKRISMAINFSLRK